MGNGDIKLYNGKAYKMCEISELKEGDKFIQLDNMDIEWTIGLVSLNGSFTAHNNEVQREFSSNQKDFHKRTD